MIFKLKGRSKGRKLHFKRHLVVTGSHGNITSGGVCVAIGQHNVCSSSAPESHCLVRVVSPVYCGVALSLVGEETKRIGLAPPSVVVGVDIFEPLRSVKLYFAPAHLGCLFQAHVDGNVTRVGVLGPSGIVLARVVVHTKGIVQSDLVESRNSKVS